MVEQLWKPIRVPIEDSFWSRVHDSSSKGGRSSIEVLAVLGISKVVLLDVSEFLMLFVPLTSTRLHL